MSKRFPWPCSKVSEDLMHRLYLLGRNHKQPITVLIAQALEQYCSKFTGMPFPDDDGREVA